MNFKEQESATKLRGGYYTPMPIARFLTKWVLLKKPRTVLEPSCGDGAFVRAFLKLHRYTIKFTGVEIQKEEASKARNAIKDNKNLRGEIVNEDFLAWAINRIDLGEKFDAVVGNPPYIRYQYLEEMDQKLAENIFKRYQLAFTKHTNAWVPFVIASIGLLAPTGRLAMVIPSELLHILHAAPLRKFLLRECSRILIIDPNELLFEEALQGTVLLMIEKKSNPNQESEGVSVVPAVNNDFLDKDAEPLFNNAIYMFGEILDGKWLKIFLSPDELAVFEKVRKLSSIHRFKDIASVDVGIVTGANKYFLVDNATVLKYDLTKFAQPMFGRSEHCPGIIYSNSVHQENESKGLPSNFINFGNTPLNELPEKAQEYVLLGESQKLHKRYKCRIRTPWYSVPSVYSTPIGMLKRSHNYPRLILNSANAFTTDTAYRICMVDNNITSVQLVYSFINSLTALTAELEGRHYGGGVLELVPSEIEKLLIPVAVATSLDLEVLDAEIKSSMDADILFRKQDDVVLKAAGLTKKEREIIHEAWRRMRNRRHRLIEQADEDEA